MTQATMPTMGVYVKTGGQNDIHAPGAQVMGEWVGCNASLTGDRQRGRLSGAGADRFACPPF